MALNLWEHQERALRELQGRVGFGLFCEVGTGKTAVICKRIEELVAMGHKRHLIVAPKSVCPAWGREFHKFTEIGPMAQVITDMPKPRKIQCLMKLGASIHIINYESLRVLQDCLPTYDSVTLDESHFVKNHKALRTKAVIYIGDKAKFRYILTGTPIAHNMMDIFSQFRFMDGGDTFGSNFFSFRGKYFEDKNSFRKGTGQYFPDWRPRVGTKESIFDKIKVSTMSLTKAECLDLPAQVYKRLDISLSRPQGRAYADMEKELISYLDDKAATAQIALTKALRLQQIANGFVTVEDPASGDKSQHRFENAPKLGALMTELETITTSQKVIVWANFRFNLDEIYEACVAAGYKPARMYGDHSGQDQIDLFQNDQECRVIVANPQSGGAGITLTASSVAIFFSNSFNFAHRAQAEGRNHRIGSEVHESITYIDMVSTGTIEEDVIQCLRERKSFADAVLNLKTRKRSLI